MNRQEIVDEIVLKRDSKDPDDIARVEELRQMLIEVDLEIVANNKSEQMKDEEELEQFSEKVRRFKRKIKISILILSILFLLAALAGVLISFWAFIGLVPLAAAMLIIYFTNRQKMIGMEVELAIKEGKPKSYN